MKKKRREIGRGNGRKIGRGKRGKKGNNLLGGRREVRKVLKIIMRNGRRKKRMRMNEDRKEVGMKKILD